MSEPSINRDSLEYMIGYSEGLDWAKALVIKVIEEATGLIKGVRDEEKI
jgi:hypothetical protein